MKPVKQIISEIALDDPLVKYYPDWYKESIQLAKCCHDKGNFKLEQHYLARAAEYKKILDRIAMTNENECFFCKESLTSDDFKCDRIEKTKNFIAHKACADKALTEYWLEELHRILQGCYNGD